MASKHDDAVERLTRAVEEQRAALRAAPAAHKALHRGKLRSLQAELATFKRLAAQERSKPSAVLPPWEEDGKCWIRRLGNRTLRVTWHPTLRRWSAQVFDLRDHELYLGWSDSDTGAKRMATQHASMNEGAPQAMRGPFTVWVSTQSSEVARTLAHASALVRTYITQRGIGASRWSGGKAGHVYDSQGQLVAQISYNGRVWRPGPYPQQEIIL